MDDIDIPRHDTLSHMRAIVVVAAIVLAAATALTSCEKERQTFVQNMGDGSQVPTMSTIDVKTFISDSGYTKYYITTPVWDMYMDANPPFWFFPQGVELEQYDNKLKKVASIRCDSAKYLSQQRIWRLDGHVEMVNTRQDTFLTQQVFWDQAKREIFTDSFIHIVKERRIIEGRGFTSNEQMTSFTVKHPMGIFPREQFPASGSSDRSGDNDGDNVYRDNRIIPPPASSRESTRGGAMIWHDTTSSRTMPLRQMPQ